MKKLFLLAIAMVLAICSFSQSNDPDMHVYEAERLRTIRDTATATGTVTLVSSEIDGDYHIRLRLDSGDVQMCHRNYTKQDSCLVVEVVCARRTFLPICKCDDYVNQIPIPKVGTRVRATGKLVFDRRHRWIEIHPVYRLELIGAGVIEMAIRN